MMDTALELRGVVKRYRGFSLSEVSFSLPRGYIMGLIGPNGAGKTTIVKLLLNLVWRERGEILAFGQDVRTAEVAVRSRIGFVHEVPAFYDHLTVESSAAILRPFYPTWDEEGFSRLARQFEIPLKKRVYALSRGTRTKLALALALSHRAELLVLDEPTTGLDPVFRRELLDLLRGCIEDGRTSVLFSTHITTDLERIADYVTLIHDGRVVFSLPEDQIRERWGLVKGDVALLTDETRALFRGLEVGEFGFTALTDDVERARCALGPAGAVFGRPSFEDLMVHLAKGKPCSV